MTIKRNIVLLCAASFSLAACRMPEMPWAKPKAPTGQVVATVDGEEITQRELEAEMAGFHSTDPKARKAAEQKALSNIIARRILAAEAKKEHVDQSPEFLIADRRGTDTLLADLLAKKVATSVPPPTDDEARRYVVEHPDQFDQRKVFDVDALRVAQMTQAQVKGLQPLKTLEDVENYLKANNIKYQRGSGSMDSVQMRPDMVAALLKMPKDELFIYPAQGYLMINHIKGVRVVPFAGDNSVKLAKAVLKQQRTQEAVYRQMGGLMKAASSKIRYNASYAPPPPPAKPATTTPASATPASTTPGAAAAAK